MGFNILGRGAPGDGGGAGGVHATIAAADGVGGVEVRLEEDAAWALESVATTPEVLPFVTLPGTTAGASLKISVPFGRDIGFYASLHDTETTRLRVSTGNAAVAGARAVANFAATGGTFQGRNVDITLAGTDASQQGSAGNDWDINFLLTLNPLSATVDVAGRRINVSIPSNNTGNLGQLKTALEALAATHRATLAYKDGAQAANNIVLSSWNNGASRVDFTGGATAAVAEVSFDGSSAAFVAGGPELRIQTTTTLTQIKTLLELATSIWDSGDNVPPVEVVLTGDQVAITGSGASTVAVATFDTSIQFAGGQESTALEVTSDAGDKLITVNYSVVNDTLSEILDAINNEGTAFAVLIHDTEGADAPEVPGWTRPFRGAAGPGGNPITTTKDSITYVHQTLLAQIASQALVNSSWTSIQYNSASVVVPETGDLGILAYAISGTSDGVVTHIRVPCAQLRASATAGEFHLPLGTNRRMQMRVDGAVNNYLQLRPQTGQSNVDGNYFIHIDHITEVAVNLVTEVLGSGVIKLIDSSGEEPGNPTSVNKGEVHVDAYKHDIWFPVRKQRAKTNATGVGTALAHAKFSGESSLGGPPSGTAVGQIFLHLPSDTWRRTYTSQSTTTIQWQIIAFRSDVVPALGLIAGTITDAEYIGQFRNANAAAVAVPASAYTATTRYYFYNRATGQAEYLSAYVAPANAEEYWDNEHVLTQDNRNPPAFELWGFAQTARVSAPAATNRFHSGGNLQLAIWKAVPSKLHFDATAGLVKVLTEVEATALVGADSRPTATNRANIYLQFAPGTWDFEVLAAHTASGNIGIQTRLVKVISTATDKNEGVSPSVPFNDAAGDLIGTPDIGNAIELHASLIEVEAGDVFYFAYVSNGALGNSTHCAQALIGRKLS